MCGSVYYDTGETTIKSGQIPSLDTHGIHSANEITTALHDCTAQPAVAARSCHAAIETGFRRARSVKTSGITDREEGNTAPAGDSAPLG